MKYEIEYTTKLLTTHFCFSLTTESVESYNIMPKE